MALEGLSIAAIFLTAGGIADVPDAGVPCILLHQLLAPFPMGQAKDLADRAQLLVRVDELLAFRIVSRDSSGKLPTILEIKQHAR